MASDDLTVRVRMYRQGLGDCFLLTFTPTAGGATDEPAPVHVLVDCGVDWNTTDGTAKIRAVAEDVLAEVGPGLDLLVVTHEHWDHVSGFERARETFERLAPEAVWLAWTEDPDDPFAKTLEAETAVAVDAVAYAAKLLVDNRAAAAAERESLAALGEASARVLTFLGVDALGAAAFSKTSDSAMDFVSSLKHDDDYCLPGGTPRRLEGLPGVRFYVLGPPKDERLLQKMDPASADPETYEIGAGFDERRSFYAGLEALGAGEAPALLGENAARRLRDYPFAVNRRLEPDSERVRELFAAGYLAQAEAWRRIDHDWLRGVSDLALQLDNAINNTSLVLAVELVASGRVLLLAADAQIGNWLSWHDLEFTVDEPDGAPRTVTTAELLERTVLYKVGHHGSHNATLRQQGLELMTSPELVAMVPVDEEYAHDRKHWSMPHPPLYQRLLERTQGRVLRVDRAWPSDADPRPETLSEERWRAFKAAVTVTDLYLDYTL